MFDDSLMDDIFAALSHSTRRKILDLLRDSPGMSVGVLARSFDVSRIAIMNHLTVLEKAQLVISQKEGRSRLLYLNLVPLQMIHERWSDDYGEHWAGRLTDIKYMAEQKARGGKE